MTEIGTLTLLKIFIPAALTFAVGIFITPLLMHYFVKYQMWKKVSRKSDDKSVAFKQIHNEAGELSTPRVGGIVIWLSVDLLQIFGKGNYANDHSKYRKIKAGTIILIVLFIGWWFVFKLGVTAVHIPFYGSLDFGIFYILFFIMVMLATFSASVIDGIDGLSAGVLAPIFMGYAAIAFLNHQNDLAAFTSAVSGGTLAFLWFNIPPARFYMGETGMLALTVVLSVLAFMTDTVFILPIIALPLVATSFSVIVQLLSKKFRGGKKVFLVAPLHHH